MNKIIKIIFLLSLSFLVVGCSSVAVIPDELVTLSLHEKKIIDGESFFYSVSSNLNISQSAYFLGCSNGSEIYFENFNLQTESNPFYVKFYESPTLISNGTQQTANNVNRNYNNSHTLSLYTNPTFSDKGDQLFITTSFGDKKISEELIFEEGLILKSETCYLFEISNNASTQDSNFVVNFMWHE